MTDYNQAEAGNYLTGPAMVDANGVPVRDATQTKELNSPTAAIIQIQQGTSTQILPPSNEVRQITITNIGTVPVYLSNVDPGPSIIDVTAYPGIGNYQFVINGSRLKAGEPRQIVTKQVLYAFTRPVGGAGLIAVNT